MSLKAAEAQGMSTHKALTCNHNHEHPELCRSLGGTHSVVEPNSGECPAGLCVSVALPYSPGKTHACWDTPKDACAWQAQMRDSTVPSGLLGVRRMEIRECVSLQLCDISKAVTSAFYRQGP